MWKKSNASAISLTSFFASAASVYFIGMISL
jgi:hypothetical protein